MNRITIAVAFVLAFAARRADAQLLSPGPLASAHATIDGDDDCSKCHESGKQVVARLCLDCHKDLGAEITASRGLHGREYKAKACEECHVEHLGRTARLVRWPGGAMDKLDHGQTGWPLDGGHKGVLCAKCHNTAKMKFVGTTTACGGCHKDPHLGRFTAQCQKCHAVQDWKKWDPQKFDHKLARYPLTGKHETVECAKCHGTPQKWQPIAFAGCDNCHTDPHKGQFKPQACAECHDTRGWQAATDTVKSNHPKLSLAAGHAKVACKTCHDRGNDKPPTKGSTCVACHAPVHVAQFGTRCEQCHASIKWLGLPDSVGRGAHGKTLYPLAGKHQTTACAGCHPTTKPEAVRYRKLRFDACNACHGDEHKGEFASRDGGECAQCHTVAGFAPTTFGVAQHVTTGYTLDGKHAATPCGACHTGPRPRLGWIIAQSACLDCHENPHGTQFAKEMVTGGCAHCHTSYGWNQAKVDHSTFPLTGAHARTSCQACHGKVEQGAAAAAFRGIPRECDGCHEDNHAGQFRQTEPVKTCKTCHATETWKIAAFDHSKTRYPLEGAHVKLECEKCHENVELRGGTSSVRWRLGYFKCKDCHADPHRSPK